MFLIQLKATAIDIFSCRFSKRIAEVLVELISDLYDFSIKVNFFQKSCNIAEVKSLLFKKFEN